MIRVVTAENRTTHTRALVEMHRQRKAVFVDQLGWDLVVTGGLEIDGYDVNAGLKMHQSAGVKMHQS